jgi:hypothetical protein
MPDLQGPDPSPHIEIEHPASGIEHPASNIQHPTSRALGRAEPIATLGASVPLTRS